MEYDKKMTGSVKAGFTDDCVRSMIKMLERTAPIHNRKEAEWQIIQRLIEDGFTVSNPNGTKKINSKVLYQAALKMINKMKPLDFQVHGSGRDEIHEKLVTDGVGTVMDEGGFSQCFRDKGGIAMKTVFFGDSFLPIGTIDDSPYPIQFRVASLSSVYVDNHCNDIRDPIAGLSANELCIIYEYSMAQFEDIYPEFKGKVAKGDIPRAYKMKKMLEKSWDQTFYNEEDTIEVAHYFNLGKKTYLVAAGASCTVIQKYKGKDYPFIKRKQYEDEEGKAYIPVLHFKCFPSTEGFYNYGLGHYLFDIAIIMAQMDNMAYRHAGDNIDPIQIVNVPKDKTSQFFNSLVMAHEQRASGGKGYAVMERNIDGTPGGSEVNMIPFQSQPITQEWERAFTRLEQQIARIGIPLDAADRGANVTATQVLSEEENSDQLIKQTMEFNASESKFLVEVVLDMIRDTVDPEDDTPLNLTTAINLEGQEVQMKNITLGAVADELQKYRYFVRINSRSGAIPSNIMQQAQVAKALPLTPPGSPAYNKLVVKLMKLNDQDISMEDIAPQQQPQMPQEGGGQPDEQALAPAPSETDPLARQKGFDTVEQPAPAF